MKATVLSPTLNKMQGQATNQDKIFEKHVSDKSLYSDCMKNYNLVKGKKSIFKILV